MKQNLRITIGIFSLAILLLVTSSFSLKKNYIRGKITLVNIPTEVNLQKYDFKQGKFIDISTIKVSKEGDFAYELPILAPVLFQLNTVGKRIQFPMDKKADITIKIDSAGALISGTKHVMAIENFKQLIEEGNMRHFGDLMKAGNQRGKMQDKQFVKKMMNEYKNVRLKAFYAELQQAVNQMGNSLAALYCLNFFDINKSYPFLRKKVTQLNQTLPKEFTENWNNTLAKSEKVSVGKKALWPENTVNIKNEKLELSELNDKFVIIDFWAGWCKPCLIELPFYADIYKKYQGKIEIIGVNRDRKKEQCENLVGKFNIPWQIVFEKSRELVDIYQVRQLPQNIIVNKLGEIIAKNLSVWEIDELLKKEVE